MRQTLPVESVAVATTPATNAAQHAVAQPAHDPTYIAATTTTSPKPTWYGLGDSFCSAMPPAASSVATVSQTSGLQSGAAVACSHEPASRPVGSSAAATAQIIIVLILTFATMKMDGIREGTIVLLTVLLSQIVKLPDEGYALVLGSTMIVDQIAAVVDVTGNAAISYIICHSEGGVKSVNMKDFL